MSSFSCSRVGAESGELSSPTHGPPCLECAGPQPQPAGNGSGEPAGQAWSKQPPQANAPGPVQKRSRPSSSPGDHLVVAAAKNVSVAGNHPIGMGRVAHVGVAVQQSERSLRDARGPRTTLATRTARLANRRRYHCTISGSPCVHSVEDGETRLPRQQANRQASSCSRWAAVQRRCNRADNDGDVHLRVSGDSQRTTRCFG